MQDSVQPLTKYLRTSGGAEKQSRPTHQTVARSNKLLMVPLSLGMIEVVPRHRGDVGDQ